MFKIKKDNIFKNYFDRKTIKIIMSLAIPVIIENILQVLLGTTDTYFAGKLNSNAIAGVGVTNLIMNIYIAFFTAVGIGTTTIVSRNIGLNQPDTAANAVKQSIILTVGISLIIGIISYIFAKPILTILGVKPEVLIYALPYFKTIAVPSVFLCLMLVLSSALRGAGDTKTPMVVTMIANLINIVLDYILIFGFYNFKGLGILGGGLATTISRIIASIILLITLSKGKTVIKLNGIRKWKIDKKLLLSISKIGIPAGVEKLIMRFGQLVYGSIIIDLGTSSYVAHNVAGTIESYSYLPAMGFGIAAATLVGNNLGANKPEESKKYALVSNFLSTILMVIMGIFFFITAPYLAALFTKDKEVQQLVVSVLRIIALFQPFLSLTMVISSSLQGAGDTKFPMYSTFIGIWGIRVVLGYLFAIIFKWGLVGIWLAYSFDITIRGIMLLLRFLNDKWKYIEFN
ncbi:MATE family efflux transporter (plasmid) [Haloimpatiens sp. FM7330]|uniref:MATE family efflux transporter n=1 Tax=Haloimpatiens sp. FM7330 TaxID=3298610 RepID=UPI00362C9F1F